MPGDNVLFNPCYQLFNPSVKRIEIRWVLEADDRCTLGYIAKLLPSTLWAMPCSIIALLSGINTELNLDSNLLDLLWPSLIEPVGEW